MDGSSTGAVIDILTEICFCKQLKMWSSTHNARLNENVGIFKKIKGATF